MFERILVPLDGSPRAELILPQLARLLKREDSEIVLLRAYNAPPSDEWLDRRPILAAQREAAQAYVHEISKRFRSDGVKVHARVVEGPDAETILDVADEEGATLIAMSTHGRSGVARWLMGSVAEKVVRASRVPVLLVRSFRAGKGGDLEPVPAAETPFRRILVPTDGSRTALAAVGPAVKFAQLYGSEALVLHVRIPYVPPGPVLPGMELGALPIPEPPPPEKDEATAKSALRFEQAGLKARRLTVTGDPAAEIIGCAAAEGADLIALATHGRSGLSRWMLGSVTERVLRHAPVPLLIVREDEKKAKKKKRRA
jgi:nucleotide-binding universal stress UspA family protein